MFVHTPTVFSLLAVSFPLGMVHAFDPDHVLAVATLTGRQDRPSHALSYAAHWAIGHGGLLLLITIAALGFHWVLPQSIPYWAERSVGIILILTGCSVLWNIRKERSPSQGWHSHGDGWHGDGWHHHDVPGSARRPFFRAPLLIGIVHGTAGSAVFLALIPAIFLSPAMGVIYVVIFSLGVLAGMLCFAAILRRGQGWISQKIRRLGYAFRGTLAVVAMCVGVFWIVS